MNQHFAGLSAAILLLGSSAVAQPDKPTIVLVHGAFADSSSWNAVVGILEKDGYNVVAAANPLRGVSQSSLRLLMKRATSKRSST